VPVSPDYIFTHQATCTANADVLCQSTGGQTITALAASAAATYKIVSASEDDKGTTEPGTGMRTVRIWSISLTDYQLQYEDVTLNADTAVTLTETDIYTFLFAEGLTAGSGGKAAGHITVTNNAGNAFYLGIDANGYTGFSGRIYVPKGARGVLDVVADSAIATTATDSFRLDLAMVPDGGLIRKVATAVPRSPGAHTNTTGSVHLQAGLRALPALYTVLGSKIGTTNQTVNYILRLAFAW
jgi:hypothetical protein